MLYAYGFLTILHDHALKNGHATIAGPDIWPPDDQFAKLVRMRWREMRDNWSAWHEVIDMALNDVRADLTRTQQEDAASEEPPETNGKLRRKMSKEEANVRARQLLMATPIWGWTARKLAGEIPCPLGWIPGLPAWRAYHEKREALKRAGTINTVSLTDTMETVLGTGGKDEVLSQLIAEQEREEREDDRHAKLYLSHERKTRRRES